MNRKGNGKGDDCEPAASVIAKFGGVRELARQLKLNPSTVSKWQTLHKKKGRVSGGCDGLIPARYHATLLAMARAQGVSLRADDLIQQ